MSTRERRIALGVGAALLLYVLDAYALEPYIARRNQIASRTTEMQRLRDEADMLLDRERRLQKVWREMQSGGLKSDVAAAETQALRSLQEWARASGLSLEGITSSRVNEGKDSTFRQSSFDVTATGTLASISRMLWHVETATIPVRVNEVHVMPRTRENTDDLKMQLTISTLSLLHDPDKANKPAAAGGTSAAAGNGAAAAAKGSDRE